MFISRVKGSGLLRDDVTVTLTSACKAHCSCDGMSPCVCIMCNIRCSVWKLQAEENMNLWSKRSKVKQHRCHRLGVAVTKHYQFHYMWYATAFEFLKCHSFIFLTTEMVNIYTNTKNFFVTSSSHLFHTLVLVLMTATAFHMSETHATITIVFIIITASVGQVNEWKEEPGWASHQGELSRAATRGSYEGLHLISPPKYWTFIRRPS